jgi:hypothetical protein
MLTSSGFKSLVMPSPFPGMDLYLEYPDIFSDLYDRARYATRIDYRQPLPPPALSEIEQQWVEALIAPFQDA